MVPRLFTTTGFLFRKRVSLTLPLDVSVVIDEQLKDKLCVTTVIITWDGRWYPISCKTLVLFEGCTTVHSRLCVTITRCSVTGLKYMFYVLNSEEKMFSNSD